MSQLSPKDNTPGSNQWYYVLPYFKFIPIGLTVILALIFTWKCEKDPELLNATLIAVKEFWVENIASSFYGNLVGGILISIMWGALYKIYIDRKGKQALRDVVFESMFDERTKQSLRDIIFQTIYHKNEALRLFDQKKLEMIIKLSFCALIGESRGNAYFEKIVTKSLDNKLPHRQQMNYVVKLKEITNELFGKSINSENYLCLQQTLSYRKGYLIENNSDDANITLVIFAFNRKALEEQNKDSTIFFREVLELDENIQRELINDNGILRNFVLENMDFKISCKVENSAKYTPIEKSNYAISATTEVIKIQVAKKAIIKKKNTIADANGFVYYDYKIEFRMPWLKTKGSFTFVIVEPSENTNFSIQFPKDIKLVAYEYFGPNAEECMQIVRDNIENEYALKKFEDKATSMIFPRSGIVFFWQKK